MRLDGKRLPDNVVLLVKADGRWTQAASWGKFDPTPFRKDRKQQSWFLESFYNDARGFLGWGDDLLDKARSLRPDALGRDGRSAGAREVDSVGSAAGQDRG